MSVIAIVPARGGSVGLPRKNILPFHGVPLVARTVKAAIGAKKVDRVLVSSDSLEILAAAEAAGAEPILRPKAISDSHASSESALEHALINIEASENDTLVFLQCTSPFTSSDEIDTVVSALDKPNVHSAFSASEDHGFIWEVGEAGLAEGVTHDHTKQRQLRQEMTPRYRENGAIYAANVGKFLAAKNRFCGNTVLVPVSSPSLEIDTPEDWQIADAVYGAISYSQKMASVDSSLIKAVITDFDGVHTDDSVYVDQEGIEVVKCSRSDGFGLEILRKNGLKLLVLSKESNPVVQARAAKLKMEVLQNIGDKVSTLDKWLKSNNLQWCDVAYIGNDLNDLGCIQKAGLGFAPANAVEAVKSAADVCLISKGGQGALREMANILID
ncbi:acylneuraminate cytidylyltransferase [Polycladidibacter stylochi]|uniref:acylneuraminate cytidylyltransferase n=1 Tax=Polycladidibacter stylochi TaxID=1807766 RepID=UPI0008319605|nr:acylneuraminate cytidylyltransferase [Pseudovibrio stylochi]